LKKLIQFIGYTLLILILIISLLPKIDLYYELEHRLKKENIVLSDEIPSDKFLQFSLENTLLYYNDINMASFSRLDFLPLIFFNRVTVDNIKLQKAMQMFLPPKIDKITITYSIIDPMKIYLVSKGQFGKAEGTINLKTRKLHIVLLPSVRMKRNHSNTLGMMKLINGHYIYDKVL